MRTKQTYFHVFLSSRKESDICVCEVLCVFHGKCFIFQLYYVILHGMNTNSMNMFSSGRWHTLIFKRRIIKHGVFLKVKGYITLLWKIVWRFLKKLRLELPHDPASLLLGIYPKDKKTWMRKYMKTYMFIAALFTVAKIWKQLKCPSMDEWIK